MEFNSLLRRPKQTGDKKWRNGNHKKAIIKLITVELHVRKKLRDEFPRPER
jgi:hypothetical protein